MEIVHQIAETLPDDMRKRSAVPVAWEADAGPGALTADEQVEAKHPADVLVGQSPVLSLSLASALSEELPRHPCPIPVTRLMATASIPVPKAYASKACPKTVRRIRVSAGWLSETANATPRVKAM